MVDFLVFRKMITPALVQIIFWILVFSSAWAGLRYLQGGADHLLKGLPAWPSFDFFLPSPAVLFFVIIPLVTRIFCECLILFFRMNSTLTDIRKNTTYRQT